MKRTKRVTCQYQEMVKTMAQAWASLADDNSDKVERDLKRFRRLVLALPLSALHGPLIAACLRAYDGLQDMEHTIRVLPCRECDKVLPCRECGEVSPCR
jgi:hypothetical protein